MKVEAPRARGYLIQLLILLSINVPIVSFGLAVGWVSLASGERAGSEGGAALVGAAAATFAAGLGGVPLAAHALQYGRKPVLVATSATFALCWSLKLAGGWCVVAGRAAAGVAGAAAWIVVPLLARETMSAGVRGAALAALGAAHTLGVLLMYLAADVPLHTTEACCLALSAVHCAACLLVPESPAFLAARGRHQEAVQTLAWVRGLPAEHPALRRELSALPSEEALRSPLRLVHEMLSEVRRRRAFVVVAVCVAGQEACGVHTLVQFAERVFVLARGAGGAGGGVSPARGAAVLGAGQLAASLLALYLVERVGRRPLLILGAVATGGSLAVGAGLAGGSGATGCVAALAVAVAADSLGLQPASYALLGDVFHYRYSECAVLLVMLCASAGNAVETLLFPAVAEVFGLPAALGLAAVATLALAVFALMFVPETKGKSPDEIYDLIGLRKPSSVGIDPKDINDTREIEASFKVLQISVIASETGTIDNGKRGKNNPSKDIFDCNGNSVRTDQILSKPNIIDEQMRHETNREKCDIISELLSVGTHRNIQSEIKVKNSSKLQPAGSYLNTKCKCPKCSVVHVPEQTLKTGELCEETRCTCM